MTDDFCGLSRDLADHLRSQGITALSPIQQATMADLLAGRDVCAAAPTGSGKTIAFAAPLMDRLGKGKPYRPAALVLSPTRELATQIHNVLAGLGKVRGRFSAAVYGGMKQGPQVNNLRRGVDVLVACPGRLEDLINQGYVHLDNVRIVVVDEADRMSDMGFLPAVRRLLDQCAPERQTVLCSATLDKASDALAKSHMHNPVRHSVASEPEELGRTTHHFWSTTSEQRAELTADVIRRTGRTIVFTRTKHGADRLADRLGKAGVSATAVHGGRSQSQRDRSLAAFHNGSASALIATDVAARGIHVDGVTCVVHFDLPPQPADYQHRSGRTARAGASGTVVALVTPDQRRVARDLQRAHGLDESVESPQVGLLGPVLDRPVRVTEVAHSAARVAAADDYMPERDSADRPRRSQPRNDGPRGERRPRRGNRSAGPGERRPQRGPSAPRPAGESAVAGNGSGPRIASRVDRNGNAVKARTVGGAKPASRNRFDDRRGGSRRSGRS